MRTTSRQNVLQRLLGALWISAFIFFILVFLPILQFSLKARQRFFVFFFKFVPIIFVDRDNARRAALRPLGCLTSHDPQLKKRGALRLLEIGAGTGANFRYMTGPMKYTNVDPNREFESLFFTELKKHPQIELERWVEAYGEDMSELASERFDVVLLTSTLCSVDDPGKVLSEAKRVLVKGGHLIFSEHVAYPRGTWQRLLQDVVNPLWKLGNCNCNLNRTCRQDLMKAVGFSDVIVNYIHVDMPTVLSRHVYGVAVA